MYTNLLTPRFPQLDEAAVWARKEVGWSVFIWKTRLLLNNRLPLRIFTEKTARIFLGRQHYRGGSCAFAIIKRSAYKDNSKASREEAGSSELCSCFVRCILASSIFLITLWGSKESYKGYSRRTASSNIISQLSRSVQMKVWLQIISCFRTWG